MKVKGKRRLNYDNFEFSPFKRYFKISDFVIATRKVNNPKAPSLTKLHQHSVEKIITSLYFEIENRKKKTLKKWIVKTKKTPKVLHIREKIKMRMRDEEQETSADNQFDDENVEDIWSACLGREGYDEGSPNSNWSLLNNIQKRPFFSCFKIIMIIMKFGTILLCYEKNISGNIYLVGKNETLMSLKE